MSIVTPRKGEFKWGTVVILAIIGLVALVIFKPELFRLGKVQVPVGVSVRPSLVGIGNVVQIRNQSDHALKNLTVNAKNTAKNQSARYQINLLQPGAMAEVGWREWSWTVAPGETISVSADDHLPIVFSSEQLGIR